MSTFPRVLLLDDQRSVLGVLREVLRKEFDVHVADDGEDALRMLRLDGPFQVVMSDMQMAGMNGIQFLRRANEIDPSSVKMLLTGHGDLETAVAAVNEANIFRFLTKPCCPRALRRAFADATARFERLDQQRHNVIGDKDRISRRMVRTQGYALLGRFADDFSGQLADINRRHAEALDEAIATAGSGGFVSVEDLTELRQVEAAVSELVSRVVASAPLSQEATHVPIGDVLERALDRVRFLSPHLPVEILGAGDLAVHAVPDLLEQALTNLMTNAFEALEAVETPAIAIDVSYQPETRTVLCAVSDNGPGIHREAMPFVLRPFFTTNGPDRAGLGLPVAQSVIESLGGTLVLENSSTGLRCLVSLPTSAVEDVQ